MKDQNKFETPFGLAAEKVIGCYAFTAGTFNIKLRRKCVATERSPGRTLLERNDKSTRLCYARSHSVDRHPKGQGERLFQLACKRDLEGIVAKRKFDPYLLDNAKWYKIRNRNYSQWVGREKLFERERSTDPNWHYWNVCASPSDQLVEAPLQ